MTTQAQQRAASARFYGFCQTCGKERDKPPAKEPYRSEYERDPYCTRTCAEDDLLTPSDPDATVTDQLPASLSAAFP